MKASASNDAPPPYSDANEKVKITVHKPLQTKMSPEIEKLAREFESYAALDDEACLKKSTNYAKIRGSFVQSLEIYTSLSYSKRLEFQECVQHVFVIVSLI